MTRTKIGGWTRIWCALSACFLALGAYTWHANAEYARNKATETYSNTVGGQKMCNDMPTKDDAFFKFMCSTPPVSDAQAAQARDQAIRQGNEDALKAGLHIWLFPTAFIAIVFGGIGWIRRGFRKQP